MKKAQVTFFIIIGIIILILISAIAFTFMPSAPRTNPGEFRPLEIILNSCINEAIDDSILLAGLYGGNPELGIIAVDASPSDINALSTLPLTFTKDRELVPLHISYENICNNANCIKTTRPRLQGNFNQRSFSYSSTDLSVEAQVSRTASKMTEECLTQRLATNSQFTITNPRVSIKNQIINEKVIYEAVLSGSIKSQSSMANNIYGRGEVQSSFKELYDIAKDLSALEIQSGFSSYLILDIITLDSSPRGKYPPFWAMDLGYNINSWSSEQVSDNLQTDIEKYFSVVRLTDSNLLTSSSSTTLPYILKRSIIDVRRETTTIPLGDDFSLSYIPSFTKPKVSFSGKNIVRGEPMQSPVPIVASILPLRSYRTYYNIRTPIIYELQNKNDGLVFRYAIESYIKSNLPVYLNSFPIAIQSGNVNDETPELLLLSEAYCESPRGSLVNIQFILDNQPSSNNGNIIFNCEQTVCSYENQNSPIRVPPCMNATLSAGYEDYSFNQVNFDTMNYDNSLYATFEGYKSKHVNVNFLLLPADLSRQAPYVTFSSSIPRSLEGTEYAILNLLNLQTGSSHSTIVSSIGSQNILMLSPGSYSYDIIVLRDLSDGRTVLIPEEIRCVAYNLFGCSSRYLINKIEINDSMVLSTLSVSENEPLYINPEQLNNGATINILVPIIDIESVGETNRVMEHMSLLGEINSHMNTYGRLEVT